MERKRTASQRVPTIVDTKSKQKSGSQKPAKLVLKVPPAASSAKRTKRTSILEDCSRLETSEEVLDHLLLIHECHLPAMAADLEKSVDVLQGLWRSHGTNGAVCLVLIRLLAQLAIEAETFPIYLQEFVLSLLEQDDADVKVVGLKCLQQLAKHFIGQLDFCQNILQVARKEIHNIHHAVRVESLKLIGHLCHVTSRDDPEISLAVLEEHCNDGDPRVRTAAFEAMCLVHKQGVKLPFSVYFKASESLLDNSEEVRVMAVQLVWAIGLERGDHVIPLKQDSSLEMKLVDDAFIKICDMVNDISMRVRALAAELLGDFHNVSTKFLEQTLDKKLMSHLKVVKSEHERQRDLHAGGGSMDWDSGKAWGSSVPKIELDPSEINLMSAGACGAFIHGLEDEFMEVRSAAVESVCRLSIKCHNFAAHSLDFLVDMFNDEIQSVRLKAISGLRQVSANMELREDQLETILGVLEESSLEIREALHGLLSSCRITTAGGLSSTVRSLLDSLRKYPSDSLSIWRCLQQLGTHHGSLVSTLVPQLLSTHPFFMGKEPDVDDPAYICILILVFNAAMRCPTISPQFPSHVFRHYTYLRDTLPDLIPWIRFGMPTVKKLSPASRSAGQAGAKVFLCQVLSRAHSASPFKAKEIWQTCISDLQKVAGLDPRLSAIASCSATFLQCQLLIGKVAETLSQDILLSSDGPGQHNLPHTIGSIRELFMLSYRLEHTYTDLTPELSLKVRLARVVAHAMLLLLAVQLDLDTEQSDQFSRMKQCFLERLIGTKRFCDTHCLSLPPMLAPLVEMDMLTVAVETLTQSLQPVVQANFCTNVTFSELLKVKQCRAELLEPQDSSKDDFTKFVACLALSVPVRVSLHNVPNWERVAIQVKFPDGRKLLISPKVSDVRETGENEGRIDSNVIISHRLWTDPCQVELCVVTRCPLDMEEEDSCFPLCTALRPTTKTGLHIHTGPSTVHSHTEDSLEKGKGVLAISDVVRISVHPQESSSKSFNVFQ